MGFVVVRLLLLFLGEHAQQRELLAQVAVLGVVHDLDLLLAALGHGTVQVAFVIVKVLDRRRVVRVLENLERVVFELDRDQAGLLPDVEGQANLADF